MAGLYCRYTSAPFSFPFFFGWVRRDWRKLFPGLVIFFPHSSKYDQNSWPENENSVVIYRPKCHQRVCAAAGSIHLIQLNMHEPPKPQTDLKRCYLCPFYARKWRRLSHSEEKGVKSTNKLVGNKRNFFLHLNSTSWRVPKIKVYTFVVVSLESVPHTLNLDQLYELTADFSIFFFAWFGFVFQLFGPVFLFCPQQEHFEPDAERQAGEVGKFRKRFRRTCFGMWPFYGICWHYENQNIGSLNLLTLVGDVSTF